MSSPLTEYASKSVELKVIKDIVNTSLDILRDRKITLKEEYQKLNEANYDVWEAENTFCTEIWKFSFEHKFNEFFDRYPHDKVTKFDEHQINKVKRFEDLRHEINIIENEISVIRERHIDKKIKNASLTLNNLKLYSEEIVELLRLLDPPTKSLNMENMGIVRANTKSPLVRNERNTSGNVPREFVNAKKLLNASKFRPRVAIGQSITATIKTMTPERNKRKERFGKFVLKKRSNISIRFERYQKYFEEDYERSL